jgi:hypothetical protein
MFSEAVQIALIVSVPPTVTALGAIVLGVINHQKIGSVKHDFDGQMTQLLLTKDKLADEKSDASYMHGKEDQRGTQNELW